MVSNYKPRGLEKAKQLLASIRRVHPDILLVINDDEAINPSLTEFENNFRVLIRPNTGMNIGAWDAAWRHSPEFDYYLFLQDECSLLDDQFLDAYAEKLSNSQLGLVGERLNPKWERPWPELQRSAINYRISDPRLAGNQLSRVDFYRSKMREWGIDPGDSGRHLSSLVWALSMPSLESLGGFPIGVDKEECIAAEIAVSRQVIQKGGRVEQVDQLPFRFFAHEEWRSDGLAKK